MKTFDEALIPEIDILMAPVTWVMAMREKTDAVIEDLEDYARRRQLWEAVRQESPLLNGEAVPGSVIDTLKYLLGMEHLR